MEDTQPPADDGKKKGGKAAAKGGKAPDESLKEELEQIRTVTPRGWILVNFPRNLNQMKLLETSLSGYISKADLPKGDDQSKFESWS